MPGPPPKDQAIRQRRNTKSTKALLKADSPIAAPGLPILLQGQAWHLESINEWGTIWRSPMAQMYGDADIEGLKKYIALVNDYWWAESSKERKELSAEIRQVRRDFGLTPQSRATLQWEVERADDAQSRGERRRRKSAEVPSPIPAGDPREALTVIQGGRN